jgi:glycosyltransferase involved in cell wall biosynthesis
MLNMKIHYLWGGMVPSKTANSVQVMKMSEAFSKLGHSISLIHSNKLDRENSINDSDVFDFYGVSSDFDLTNINSRPGVFRHYFGFKIAMRAKKHKPDVVFARNLSAAAWSSIIGIPTIFEVHAPFSTFLGKIYMWMLTRGKGFRKIILITHALKKEMQKNIPSKYHDCMFVEPDGVNLDHFEKNSTSIRKKLGISDDDFVVGYTGSFHSGKGSELIVPIAKCVKNVKFLVVGGSDQEVLNYKKLCEKDGIENINWLGFRPNNEIPALIQCCDLLLLPNQKNVLINNIQDIGCWTSPLKMFEYMAASKIILSSDLDVLKEVLNRDNAIFCAPDKLEEWVDAINEIKSSPQKFEVLAQQARNDVMQYTWIERAKRCLEKL